MGWKKGETIVNSEPYAYVLSQEQRGIRCDSCFQRSENLKKCTGCRFLYYCGRACQKNDWYVHKQECQSLPRVTSKKPTDSVRLLLRLLIRHELGDESKLESDPVRWRTFAELKSHQEEISTDTKRSEILGTAAGMLSELLGDSLSGVSGSQLLETFGKMLINSFSICDDEMQSIGVGIYLSASLFDHRCHPNAVAVFTGTKLTVRCVEDIDSDSPRDVYLSYVDQLAPSDERRKQLSDQYYFRCECDRCQDHDLDGLMKSAECPTKDCSGHLNFKGESLQQCQVCHTCVPDNSYFPQVCQVMRESKEGIASLDDMKKKEVDAESRLQLSESLLKKQSVLSPYNVYRVKMLDRAMDACIDSCRWKEALEFAEKTVQPYLKLHPPYTPTVGVHLMKIGKLQLYLKQCTEATKSLQQAESILRVTHGTSHGLYKDLSELLDQCAEEQRMMMEHGHGDVS